MLYSFKFKVEVEYWFHGKESMATQRYGMAVRLKDEKREYYIENHANVWPEVLEELKKIHVKNYSIFLKVDFMFGPISKDIFSTIGG